MPIGKGIYFEGDITQIKDRSEYLGFFEVELDVSDSINRPIIQIKHNKRTIAPTGKFKMWIFSEELFNAVDLQDIKYTIIRGYYFNRGNIFKNFVNDLYQLRLTFNKSHPP